MIYIATVHHKTDTWMPIQLKYIVRNITEPFRIYACCNGADGSLFERYGKVFSTDFNVTGSEHHALNLRFLTEQIMKVADLDDLLVFLDGDAFPISPDIIPNTREWLKQRRLVAVKRLEGPSPLIPHPSYCATTIDFWRKLPGDWSPTPWRMADYTSVQDTGSKLHKRLHNGKHRWHELLRTNKYNLHTVYYGVYGGVVYHHGAAFRAFKVSNGPAKYGAHTQYNHSAALIMTELMKRHEDFYRLFTEGTYSDEVNQALRKYRTGETVTKVRAEDDLRDPQRKR